jgi:ankyrin repeat protein
MVIEWHWVYTALPYDESHYYRTALHLAARAGHAEMLKTLVENLTLAEKEKLINQPE